MHERQAAEYQAADRLVEAVDEPTREALWQQAAEIARELGDNIEKKLDQE